MSIFTEPKIEKNQPVKPGEIPSKANLAVSSVSSHPEAATLFGRHNTLVHHCGGIHPAKDADVTRQRLSKGIHLHQRWPHAYRPCPNPPTNPTNLCSPTIATNWQLYKLVQRRPSISLTASQFNQHRFCARRKNNQKKHLVR